MRPGPAPPPIFDLDFGFRAWARNQLTLNLEAPETPMFVGLLDNPGWRTGFINRYADQLNTAFLPSVTLAAIDSVQTTYTPELPEHMNRWQTPGYMSAHPGTLANWSTLLNYTRIFANERPDYARTDIVEFFGSLA